MRHAEYAYWRGVALKARRRMHRTPLTVANWHEHTAAKYALTWALMWRRASPVARKAAFGIPRPSPEHSMLMALAEHLARTPSGGASR